MPRRSNLKVIAVAATFGALALAVPSFAHGTDAELRFQDGQFSPSNVVVAANTPFKMRVMNAGGAAIEFESFELHRERVVQPGEAITVYMPSLAPGSYKFFDDFHQDTPAGEIVAK
jgi:hypothetical protein